jgi:hypothetical protein
MFRRGAGLFGRHIPFELTEYSFWRLESELHLGGGLWPRKGLVELEDGPEPNLLGPYCSAYLLVGWVWSRRFSGPVRTERVHLSSHRDVIITSILQYTVLAGGGRIPLPLLQAKTELGF